MLNCTVYKGGSIKYFFPSFLYCLLLSDWTIQLQSSEHPVSVHCMKMLMISYKVHFLRGPACLLHWKLAQLSWVLGWSDWVFFAIFENRYNAVMTRYIYFYNFFAYFISTSVSVWTRGSSISLHLHGITFHCNSIRLFLLVYLSFLSLFPPSTTHAVFVLFVAFRLNNPASIKWACCPLYEEVNDKLKITLF